MHASGGVPHDVAAAARAWLERQPEASTSFELAQLADLARLVGADASPWRTALLGTQKPDGGWPASPTLLLRAQADAAPGVPYADVRRTLTTASALSALL